MGFIGLSLQRINLHGFLSSNISRTDGRLHVFDIRNNKKIELSMFKVNVIDVVLMSLLLTLNIFYIFFSTVMVIAFWDFFDFLPFFLPQLKGNPNYVHEMLYQLPKDLRLRSLWY